MSYISISMLLLLYSEGTSTLAAFCYFCIHAYMQNCYIKKKNKKYIYLPRMVWIKKDVIARCLTHKNKCVIYLTVGDIVGYSHCIGCMNV